jgi:hypothetical protein
MFLVIRPELSGHARGDAGITFDTWLGDDLVEAHSCLLATTPIKNDLVALPDASGFTVTPAHTTTSLFFRHHSPERRLPEFWRIKVLGEAGRDDIGIAEDGATVVSRRVLDVLLRHRIARAVFFQYESRASKSGAAEHERHQSGERRALRLG